MLRIFLILGPRIVRKDDSQWVLPNEVIVFNSITVNEDSKQNDSTTMEKNVTQHEYLATPEQTTEFSENLSKSTSNNSFDITVSPPRLEAPFEIEMETLNETLLLRSDFQSSETEAPSTVFAIGSSNINSSSTETPVSTFAPDEPSGDKKVHIEHGVCASYFENISHRFFKTCLIDF